MFLLQYMYKNIIMKVSLQSPPQISQDLVQRDINFTLCTTVFSSRGP